MVSRLASTSSRRMTVLPSGASFVALAFSCDGARFSALAPLLNGTRGARLGRAPDQPVDGVVRRGDTVFFYVHRDVPGWLRQWRASGPSGHGRPAAAHSSEDPTEPVVRSLWWDLFEEEFESKTIACAASGPDFAYLRDHLQQGFVYDAALRHFGLSPADIAERAEKYERVHQERAQRRLAQAAADSSSAQSAPQAEASGSGSSVLDRRGQLHELLVANGRVPA